MRMVHERSWLVFPPHLGRVTPPAVLKVGERVEVVGCERIGQGTVISFSPDGRLVRLNIGSLDGWWSRSDLRKVNHDGEG